MRKALCLGANLLKCFVGVSEVAPNANIPCADGDAEGFLLTLYVLVEDRSFIHRSGPDKTPAIAYECGFSRPRECHRRLWQYFDVVDQCPWILTEMFQTHYCLLRPPLVEAPISDVGKVLRYAVSGTSAISSALLYPYHLTIHLRRGPEPMYHKILTTAQALSVSVRLHRNRSLSVAFVPCDLLHPRVGCHHNDTKT